jgi:hypothetical protein
MEYLLITWLEDVMKNGCQSLPGYLDGREMR